LVAYKHVIRHHDMEIPLFLAPCHHFHHLCVGSRGRQSGFVVMPSGDDFFGAVERQSSGPHAPNTTSTYFSCELKRSQHQHCTDGNLDYRTFHILSLASSLLDWVYNYSRHYWTPH
jgi:hypothetical protein